MIATRPAGARNGPAAAAVPGIRFVVDGMQVAAVQILRDGR
jgi:hypothetical protein